MTLRGTNHEIVRGQTRAQRRSTLEDGRRISRENRRGQLEELWRNVQLDQSVIEELNPSLHTLSRRGVALPLNEPEWVVHRYAHGTWQTPILPLRCWYPKFAKMRQYDRSLAPWSNAVSTALMLHLRELLRRHTGGQGQQLQSAFSHFADYLETVERFASRQPFFAGPDVAQVFGRAVVRGFAAWCEEKVPSNPDIHPRSVIGFVEWASRQGVPGFNTKLAAALRDIRLRAVVTGHVARVGHPTRGALLESERQAVLTSLRNPHPNHEPVDRALVQACWEIGARPLQLSILTWEMLEEPSTIGGAALHVPRVKQRNGKRSSAKRTISRELYDLLCAIRPTGGDKRGLIFGTKINDRLQAWARLHDLRTDRAPVASTRKRRRKRKSRKVATWWPLRLTAYRFRRTLATRLAEMGAGAATIVAALDDQTLGMATVYAANSSAIVDTLRETLDRHPQWIRLVRLFSGSVIDKEQHDSPAIVGGAIGLVEPGKHARSIGIVGYCGHESPDACTKYPPLDCYSCAKMVAVSDPAVHRRQLAQVIGELEAIKGKESDRMAVIHKEAGFAISELIVKLEENSSRVLERVVASQEAVDL